MRTDPIRLTLHPLATIHEGGIVAALTEAGFPAPAVETSVWGETLVTVAPREATAASEEDYPQHELDAAFRAARGVSDGKPVIATQGAAVRVAGATVQAGGGLASYRTYTLDAVPPVTTILAEPEPTAQDVAALGRLGFFLSAWADAWSGCTPKRSELEKIEERRRMAAEETER